MCSAVESGVLSSLKLSVEFHTRDNDLTEFKLLLSSDSLLPKLNRAALFSIVALSITSPMGFSSTPNENFLGLGNEKSQYLAYK